MDSTDRPDAHGAFNPVGHVIASFRSTVPMQCALAELLTDGFAHDEVIVYSPEQMQRQARTDIAQAGLLASIGQDLNLMKANLRAAEEGHSFLVVRTPKQAQVRRVAMIVRRHEAVRARHYGHFVTEELLDDAMNAPQVFESGDRGLDAPRQSFITDLVERETR